MTLFQILMLGASAYFAFKIYEHIQTLQDPKNGDHGTNYEEQKSAEAFSPFSPEALVQKADAAYEEEDFQKALALLQEASSKDPQNADIIFKSGYILQKSGDNDEALKRYKEALELDKDNEYIHNSMASIYRANGEFSSAKLHLQASIELNDENPITYYNYGNLLVDMKHDEEAAAMYEKAIEINPDFNEAKEELKKLKGE